MGWLGAVVCSLALAVQGLVESTASPPGDHGAGAVYHALTVLGWSVLVPFSVLSLLTGLVQGLATPWGLFRHWWVMIKLVMNVVAAGVLLLYMQTLTLLADAADTADASAAATAAALGAGSRVSGAEATSPVVHSAAAVVLLVTAAALSVYKPRGLTRHGQRVASARTARTAATT